MSAPVPQHNVRTAQIIVAFLAMGVLMFTGVALVIALPKFPGVANRDAVIAIIAMALGLILVAVSILAAPRMGSQAVLQFAREKERMPEAQELIGPYITMQIIGAVPLEGAALFNGIALMLEARWWSLAMICGLLLLMAVSFPTQLRFDEWSRREREKLELRGTFQTD